jgi:Bacterial Ig-like domain
VLATGTGLGGACSTPAADQPFPGECEPLRVLSWTPLDGALDVPRDTIVSLTLDDYPDPDTVGLGGFILTTGVFYHPGLFGVDLIDKTITYSPQSGLRGDLGYVVSVRPALLSLSGCAAPFAQHSFHTSNTSSMQAPRPIVATPFAAVQPIFARSCAGAACHRAPAAASSDAGAAADAGGDACLPIPAAGLSLCDRDAVAALVGVPSRQVSRLNLVERDDSSRSYLLRKLLPGATPDRPAPSTVGHRDPPGAPLSEDELRTVARWIDQGAPP